MLYDPAGASPINLATFLRIDDGYDVGDAGINDPLLADGALFGGRGYGVRTNLREWQLPLRLASNGAWGGLRALESGIRANLGRRSYLDFQPGGVASAEAVRFDVEAGILSIDHRPRIADMARSDSVLRLWTQPFGYWPTLISMVLAGAGSQINSGAPWTAFIPAASIIGDGIIPLRLEWQLIGQASLASSGAQSRLPQRLVYSFHSQPSVPSLIWSGFVATSGGMGRTIVGGFTPVWGGSTTNPSYGPVVAVSTGLSLYVSGSYAATAVANNFAPTAFVPLVQMPLASSGGLGSYYAGRHRLYAWARPLGASSFGWLVAGLIDKNGFENSPMPTSRINTYATVAHPSVGAMFANGPSGWNVVDLGEVSWPPAGSPTAALSANPNIALWGRPLASVASWGAVASLGPSQGIEIGGFGLIPISSVGAFGILSAVGGNSSAGSDQLSAPIIDGIQRIAADGSGLRPLSAYLNGDMPVWDRRNAIASGLAVTVLPYSVPSSARPQMGVSPEMHNMAVTFRYRPTFQFLRGL